MIDQVLNSKKREESECQLEEKKEGLQKEKREKKLLIAEFNSDEQRKIRKEDFEKRKAAVL